MALKAGVKTFSSPMYEVTRNFMDANLNKIIRTAIIHANHEKKKTVTANHILRAIRDVGGNVYGY